MGEPTRVKITSVSPLPGGEPIELAAFVNPTEYSLTEGAQYAEITVPGLSVPLLQFVRGDAQVLTCELLLDNGDRVPATAERPSVKAQLETLRRLASIHRDLHAPPVCSFQWGADTAFEGVITSLNEKFQLFGEDGSLLRARVTITMKRYMSVAEAAREIDAHSPDRFKTRVVRAGDRLDLLAAEEYGDPALWRPIADENGIARPRALAPGTVLRIPPL